MVYNDVHHYIHFGHDIIHGSQSEIIVVISSLSRNSRYYSAHAQNPSEICLLFIFTIAK